MSARDSAISPHSATPSYRKTYPLHHRMTVQDRTLTFIAIGCLAFGAFFFFALEDKTFILLSLFTGVLILISLRDVVRAVEVEDGELRIVKRSSTTCMRWEQVRWARSDFPPEGPGSIELKGGADVCEINCRFFVDGQELYQLILARLSHVEIESMAVANPGIMIPYFWLPFGKRRRPHDE